MSTTSESLEVALIRRCFEAVTQGDFTPLEQALSKDAIWRSVWAGSTNCHGREEIIAVMSRNLAGPLRGSIEGIDQCDQRILVGSVPLTRPTGHWRRGSHTWWSRSRALRSPS
jgi:hypothetical protein